MYKVYIKYNLLYFHTKGNSYEIAYLKCMEYIFVIFVAL